MNKDCIDYEKCYEYHKSIDMLIDMLICNNDMCESLRYNLIDTRYKIESLCRDCTEFKEVEKVEEDSKKI